MGDDVRDPDGTVLSPATEDGLEGQLQPRQQGIVAAGGTDAVAAAVGIQVEVQAILQPAGAEAVAGQVFIPLTVGGGVRAVADIRRLLNAGADKISINTAGVNNPDLIGEAAALYGSQCIVTAVDARRRDKNDPSKGWEVYTHGGRKATGLDAVQWAKRVAELGTGEILLTSMDTDGTKAGFDLELTRAVADAVSVPVIASGGVGNLQHLADGVTKGGADAVLAAPIFHDGMYTIREAKDFMASQGITVRL